MTSDQAHIDERFMHRALQLAAAGKGNVSPNPLVGCVIVHNGSVIGEGYHQQYGGPHAEVHAVQQVADETLLPLSTVYVTLEPCSHFGKTPPCADLLISKKVGRVVIANLDTNPLVAGNGIKKLREAGIEVVTGVLDKEGRALNKRFFTFIEKQRPYIILKWAQTADGFVARENYDSKWISSAHSRQLVHKWRAEEDAILVGARTAMHDNPQLNVREWTGRSPVRIVIDRYLKLSEKLNLFDGTQRTICYNVLKHDEHPNLHLMRIDEEDFLLNLLHDLYKQKIQSVIIEGGAATLNHFIEQGLWDEARVFTSTTHLFGKGVAAPRIKSLLTKTEYIDSDILTVSLPA